MNAKKIDISYSYELNIVLRYTPLQGMVTMAKYKEATTLLSV